MAEFLAVLDYEYDPADSRLKDLATPAVMERVVETHRRVIHRLPSTTTTSDMAVLRRVAVFELDPADQPSAFIGGIHQTVHGALGHRTAMQPSPPDAFVRVYFVPAGVDRASAELWEWSHVNQELTKVI